MTNIAENSRVNRFALGFALLGGAVAWIVHLVASAVIAEWGCFAGIHRWTMLGVTLVAWLIIGVTVVMTLIALAATYIGFRLRRHIHEIMPPDERGTFAFLVQLGLVTSGVFVFIILAESLPILFFLTQC